jgi:hypothetical protein
MRTGNDLRESKTYMEKPKGYGDDSFVRAYTLNAEEIKSLLPK